MSSTILVCGSRTFSDYDLLDETLSTLILERRYSIVFSIIEGACPTGADAMAYRWRREHGVFGHRFPAEWGTYGKRAGYLRNKKTLDKGKPDLVLAFFDESPCKGTHMMCKLAEDVGVEVRRFGILTDED